jgi:hypothetical protein
LGLRASAPAVIAGELQWTRSDPREGNNARPTVVAVAERPSFALNNQRPRVAELHRRSEAAHVEVRMKRADVSKRPGQPAIGCCWMRICTAPAPIVYVMRQAT